MTTEWVKWSGGKTAGDAPVSDDVVVGVRLRDGTEMKPFPSEGIIWTHYQQSTDVVEYRIVR